MIDQLLQTINILKLYCELPSKGIRIDDSINKVKKPHAQHSELLENRTFSNLSSISKEVIIRRLQSKWRIS